MQKRITDRLSFKVFLITFIIQVLFGVMIYALPFNAAPLSWNTVRRTEMEKKFEPFVASLNTVKFSECGPLIDDFILENDCHIILYRSENPDWDDFPADVPGSEYVIANRMDVTKLINLDDNQNMSLSTSGRVVFRQNAGKVYTVVCLWALEGENVLLETLKKELPLVIAVIIAVSLVCSYIYAYLFARPVRELSDLSRKISGMDFSVRSGTKRRDEIGDLGRDLDTLSSNLDATITELRQKTVELEREIERTNELERQKEMFFIAASHELKTPITIAQGQVRGMIDGVVPYNDTDIYLPKTLSALKRMESLINEILTVSRMQADKEIAQINVDLTSLLRNKTDEIKDLLEVRTIPLEVQIGSGLYCNGNTELISMAVGSFLSNAVYYSSEGSKIVVNAYEDGGNIITEIRNTGSHIDEEDLPHLFEAFYRSDSSRNRRSGGSGLGLYLGKIIIERHNGTVTLDNDGDDVVAVITIPFSGLNA